MTQWRMTMPDLQSELAKVLNQTNFDDEPGTKEPPIMVQNKSTHGKRPQEQSNRRVVWNYVRTHPLSTVSGVAKATGLGESFCYSSIGALMASGRLTREMIDGIYRYSTISDNYEDRLLKKNVKSVKTPKKPVKPLVEIKRDLGLLPAPTPTPAPKTFDPDAIINQLNVLQAKALMVRLKQVFGEIQ